MFALTILLVSVVSLSDVSAETESHAETAQAQNPIGTPIAAPITTPDVVPEGTTSPYRADPMIQGITFGSMGALLLLSEGLVKPSLAGSPSCVLTADGGSCDPGHLNAMDRSVVGNHSHAWRLVSDIGQDLSLAVPLVGSAVIAVLSKGPHPWRDFTTDSLVMYNSVLAASLVSHALKFAIHRPRPGQYDGAFSMSAEQNASFPSGHTTAAAASTMAFAVTFAKRYPNSPWRYAMFGASILATGLTAYGRVGAGRHFYSDVLAGAVIGWSSGILLPYLYEK